MEKEKKDITVTGDNEMSLINGLLKAADYKNNEVRTIEIKRGGETPLFSFDIRPLTADEVEQARHNATNVDIIKAVLMSGEIEQVCKVLDNISGDNTALFDYAKN